MNAIGNYVVDGPLYGVGNYERLGDSESQPATATASGYSPRTDTAGGVSNIITAVGSAFGTVVAAFRGGPPPSAPTAPRAGPDVGSVLLPIAIGAVIIVGGVFLYKKLKKG